MNDLLSKLSSYNLFNYLFPGIIFAILANKATEYSLIQEDIVLGLFLYYFIGLTISRFGSLILEPFLKRISFLKFEDYKKFVTASIKDDKIALFSEINNTYRTLTSVFILILGLKAFEGIESRVPELKEWNLYILSALLFTIFLYSYKKQTDYIVKRIDSVEG